MNLMRPLPALPSIAASVALIFALGAHSAQAANAPKSGEAVFQKSCSVCHGDRGNGVSRAAPSLNPKPRDFSNATNLSREDMIFAVTNGRAGTAMMPWKSRYSAQELEGVVDYIRGRFMLTALDPKLGLGRALYGHYCQTCHGDRGQGITSPDNPVPPQNLASVESKARLSRNRIIDSVKGGKHGDSVAAGFMDKIKEKDVGSLVDYVGKVLIQIPPAVFDTPAPTPQVAAPVENMQADMSLPLPKNLIGDAQKGGDFFNHNCFSCHGKGGNGDGPRAYFINPRPRNFHDDYSHARLNRPTIFMSVTHGRPGTVMPAWGKVLSEQEIANLTEYVFQTFVSAPVTEAKADKQ
jgi:mono/diheme cytochrome c family protein